MNLKKKKYNHEQINQTTTIEIENTPQVKSEIENQPICPHCGNRYLNFLIVEKDEWNCSKVTCRKSFRSDTNPIKPAV